MSTLRVARRPQFARVDQRSANDERLSFRARGVLLWLLSKPDDWRFDSTSIAQHGTEGREAVRTALRELEQLGYLVREKRQVEGGRWVTETLVYEVPTSSTDAQEPVVGPTPRNPTPGEPDVGATGAKDLALELTTETHTQDPPPSASVCGRFDDFWSVYPRHVAKGAALKAWGRACRKATPDEIIAAAAKYRDLSSRKPEFTAYPASWLNAERWLDEYDANPDLTGRAAECGVTLW